MILQFCRSQVWQRYWWTKVNMLAGVHLFWRLWGKIHFLAFFIILRLPGSSSWGCLGFLALGPLPSSIFRASIFQSLLSYLSSVCYLGYMASSDLCTSLLKDPCEYIPVFINMGLPGWSSKDSACQCKRRKRPEFDPCAKKIPWRKKRQHTPVFLPRKCHGQRSLAGYSSRDRTVRHDWTANTFTFFCYGHWTFLGRETKFSPSASLSYRRACSLCLLRVVQASSCRLWEAKVKMKVVQLCPTLWDPMD